MLSLPKAFGGLKDCNYDCALKAFELKTTPVFLGCITCVPAGSRDCLPAGELALLSAGNMYSIDACQLAMSGRIQGENGGGFLVSGFLVCLYCTWISISLCCLHLSLSQSVMLPSNVDILHVCFVRTRAIWKQRNICCELLHSTLWWAVYAYFAFLVNSKYITTQQ